ncbi:2-phosphosulfolactate phosphatase [Salinigranum rubrum]|uniref:2-phosphosulfolactate phosphatase n=1 Tax=Salinigranum rubrum TaxID=755307 RepID=A0A2I8VEI7_9EURY|nr:2-phosphosulfolactate phosphatase [Salinigranum rubrum]AUV80284.1 2-phosphosulfolactate phosphatase [Salinigranum rubrum]
MRRTNRLDSRLIARCEEVPDDPPVGDYVVVDVLHFSNTVIELFANGADYVHITDERGDEPAFKADHPEARIGGGATPAYDPEPGYDFFNSPSYVQNLDIDGRPVGMTSSNGGRAVARLRRVLGDESAVYVGSTMNASALAAHLEGRDRPTYIVSAGSGGDEALEDHVGATLISRALDGIELSTAERAVFEEQVRTAKGPNYAQKNDLRRRDVHDYALAFDSREVIPRLEGRSLVDVVRRGLESASD